MSTFKYDSAAADFATGQLDWTSITASALLVGPDYTPRQSSDAVVQDIPSSQIVARLGALTDLGQSGGVCFGTIPELTQFLSTTPIAALVLYADNGSDDLSQLIYYSSDGVGFPFTARGFNYFVGFDQGNGGFFQV